MGEVASLAGRGVGDHRAVVSWEGPGEPIMLMLYGAAGLASLSPDTLPDSDATRH